MAFGTSIQLGNIKENWLFKLANNNSGYLYFAFSDVTYSSNFYHGVILNNPSINESIDLLNSTANTSGISISIPDFQYQGNPISQELFGGTNTYINRDCTVHSQINNDTPVKIGSFRIVGIDTDGNKLNIKLNSYRPWDFLTIPTTKTTTNNLLVPVAYGNYTANSASPQSDPQFVDELTSYDYRPVHYNKLDSGFAIYPNANSASSGAELAVYNEQFNVFVPTAEAQGATVDVDNANHAKVEHTAKHIFAVRPHAHTQVTLDSGVTASNVARMYNNSTTSYATLAGDVSAGGGEIYARYLLHLDVPDGDEKYKKLTDSNGNRLLTRESSFDNNDTALKIDTGFDSADIFVGCSIKLKEEILTVTAIGDVDSDDYQQLTVVRGQFNTTAIAHDNASEIFVTRSYNMLKITWQYLATNTSGNAFFAIGNPSDNYTVDNIQANVAKNTAIIPFPSGVNDIQVIATWSGANGDCSGSFRIFDMHVVASRQFNEPPETLYIANDGLTHGITGLNSAITSINNAHLDLLNRFTGLDVATDPDTNIDGWSTLESNRATWGARIWINEENNLQTALEKMQFEGAFIFRFKQGDATQPQYLFVKNSYSTTTTLSKNDINRVKLKHINFTNIITNIVVNYKKHPATNEYQSNTSYKSDSNRTKYNFDTNGLENSKTFNLDFLVDSNDVDKDTNRNDGFVDYYYNLFGEPKLTIDFTLVNSKFYDLEVGSVINFDNNNMYPKTPFSVNSSSWASLNFIITKTARSKGKLQISAFQIS